MRWRIALGLGAMITVVAVCLYCVFNFDLRFGHHNQNNIENGVIVAAPVPPNVRADFERGGATSGAWWSCMYEGLQWVPLDGPPPSCEGRPAIRTLAGFAFKSIPKDPLPKMVSPFGLCLAEATIASEQLEKFSLLENLQLIELSPSQVTDDVLRALNHTNRIHLLRVGGDFVQAPTSSADDVTSLHFRHTRITNAGIRELKSFRKLEELDLSNTSVDDEGLKELADLQLESLTWLFLRGTKVTNAGLKELSRLKRLGCVSILLDDEIDDAHLQALKRADLLHTSSWVLPPLYRGSRPTKEQATSLQINSEKVTAAGLRQFASLTTLECVALHLNGALDSAAVKELTEFPNLRAVQLYQLGSDDELRHLSSVKGLHSLVLEGTTITGSGLKSLAGLKDFKQLTLWSVRFVPGGCSNLAELSRLEELYVGSRGGLTDDDLAHVSKLSNLNKLTLYSTTISDEGLQKLASLKNLRELWLGDSHVTAAGKTALQKAMPQCEIYPRWN